ncbi:hypothetical protein TNCV_3634341 [Trichonephila clavipes]|nr:hypothetical protein TNCV_3634341 [Trichonephila clavipes]
MSLERFRLFNTYGRLRIWRQPHELMDPACQVETVQGAWWIYHGLGCFFVALFGIIANIWQVIPVESFQKLVESMPDRVEAVIKARGDPTRY